jgi:hypothetical protein
MITVPGVNKSNCLGLYARVLDFQAGNPGIPKILSEQVELTSYKFRKSEKLI